MWLQFALIMTMNGCLSKQSCTYLPMRLQDNVVVIIQIPLKKKQPAPTVYSGLALFGGPGAYAACCPAPVAAAAAGGGFAFGSAAAVAKPAVDVEHAIVKLGEAAGPFPSLQGE